MGRISVARFEEGELGDGRAEGSAMRPMRPVAVQALCSWVVGNLLRSLRSARVYEKCEFTMNSVSFLIAAPCSPY